MRHESDTLPDNLAERAWAGSLPKAIIKAYPKLMIGLWLFSGAVSAGFGAAVAFITGNSAHMLLAIPVTTWVGTLWFPVVLAMTTRHVRVLEPGESGRYELNNAQWFKNATTPFTESDTLYENGRRVLWVIKQGEKYVPLNVWGAKGSKENVTSAQVAAVESYRESVKFVATYRGRSRQQQIQLGVVATIVAFLLLGLYLMIGRLTDAETADPRPATETAQSESDGRTEATAFYSGRDLWA